MELLPIQPPIERGTINIKVEVNTLPKHIESLLEVTISYTLKNPNMEGSPNSPCIGLTCLLHNTYSITNKSSVIKGSIGVINEGFYIVEMTLTKGNNIGDSIARVYGIWGYNPCIVIGLPYSVFKPIEFA